MRIGRHQAWMEVAEVMARRATCYRGNYGAIITQNRDIVSAGYNGPESGDPHCGGNACQLTSAGGCARSIHAEDNAIIRARNKTGQFLLSDCELYTTGSPCASCAEKILDSGLRIVYYRYPYRLRDGIESLLRIPKISLFRITSAGMIISERTGGIVE